MREVDEDGLCGNCVELIIPKSMQDDQEDDENLNDEEE